MRAGGLQPSCSLVPFMVSLIFFESITNISRISCFYAPTMPLPMQSECWLYTIRLMD